MWRVYLITVTGSTPGSSEMPFVFLNKSFVQSHIIWLKTCQTFFAIMETVPRSRLPEELLGASHASNLHHFPAIHCTVQHARKCLKKCLAWIGIHVGIRQALIFAKAAEVHPQDLAGGCMIDWADFLG